MADKTCGIYARVSTIQQEDGTSLVTQTDRMEADALQRGDIVLPEFKWREIWTGKDLEARPVLEEVRRTIAAGLIDVLYVYSQDRLSRVALHAVLLMHEFTEAGVELRFIEGTPGDGPYAELITYIQGFVAEQEHAKIVERTMRGKEQVARSGRMPNGTNKGMYGYDYDKPTHTRTINEPEAAVLRQMFQWAAEGVNPHRICVRLNDANIPTKTGKRWHPITVLRTLGNEAYTGSQYYGRKRWRFVNGRRVVTDRPESEWIRIIGFSPIIIPQALYNQVQQQLGVRQANLDRRVQHSYLLTGLLRCGECGSGLTGASRMRGHRYYRCQATYKRPGKAVTCHARYIRADDLESIVWRKVTETIMDPSVWIWDLQHIGPEDEGVLEVRVKEVRKQIDKVIGEQSRLIEIGKIGDMDLDLIQASWGPLKMQREQKEAELHVLEEQRKRVDDAAEAGHRISQYCDKLAETLPGLDSDGQVATLKAMGTMAEVTSDDLKITVFLDPNVTTIERTSA